MATQFYLRLLKEAQEKKIDVTNEMLKEINTLYKSVYSKVSSDFKKANAGTLNERFLEVYTKELEKEIEKISKQIEKSITKGIDEVVTAQVESQMKFFNEISNKFSLNLKPTFSSMFGTIRTDVIKELMHGDMYKDRKGLSTRIWQDTKKFKKDINTVLMEGIAQKKSAMEIAKDLEEYVNPDAKKDWNWSKTYPGTSKKVDYNAQRLARTSVHHAYQQALKRSCDKNPYVDGIRWRSAMQHRTCQLCRDRHGWIYNASKNEGMYTTEEVPIDHPNGVCTLIPEVSMNMEEIGEELGRWRKGESNPKLDEWFNEYGLEFIK